MRKKRSMFSSFCEHVYSPADYLIVFIMLVAFFIGMGIFSAVTILKPMNETNTQQHTVTFSDCRIDEDNVILISAQTHDIYKIRGYPDHLPKFTEIQNHCNGITEFSVWVNRVEPDDADPYYLIYSISSGENVYLTFKDSNLYRRSELSYVFFIFGPILLFFLALSAFIFIVGSYPQKFPKWVVYLCFKKSAIDI